MEAVGRKLRRLRVWFVVGFAVQSVVGTVTAARVLECLESMGLPGLCAGRHVTRLSIAWSVVSLALLLGLALWVFSALLRRRPWARVVLLVVGWITVAGAAISLLSAGGMGALRGSMPDADLASLALVSIAGNALNLFVWGAVIATLQFDREVRAAFLPPAA